MGETKATRATKANVHSDGFTSALTTFGTIEKGKILMFETHTDRVLGEGADSCFECKDLTTGRQKALKTYSIKDEKKKASILRELHALRATPGHRKIVRYERIIESESTIFV